MTVPTVAKCSFSNSYREDQNCCVMQPYRSPIGVDEAYTRAIREYAFSSVRREYELEGDAYPDLYHGHRHLARGESYELSGLIVPRSERRLFRGLWLMLTLKADGPMSTAVEPVYCQVQGVSMEDQRLWHKAVQKNIRNTLPSTPGPNSAGS